MTVRRCCWCLSIVINEIDLNCNYQNSTKQMVESQTEIWNTLKSFTCVDADWLMYLQSPAVSYYKVGKITCCFRSCFTECFKAYERSHCEYVYMDIYIKIKVEIILNLVQGISHYGIINPICTHFLTDRRSESAPSGWIVWSRCPASLRGKEKERDL